ncbi:hypothetical protein BaRGS_00033260 [Batillaria attramentaria]|uniref:G2/mitotic-specific cyclin-B3 n=1 Tax=Batillaria attramentaria TaxID=370345 RepID=A0ABD0JKH2_9CAEN
MKRVETRRVKEQNQNTEPLGTQLGKKMVAETTTNKPRPRRAAFGDITNLPTNKTKKGEAAAPQAGVVRKSKSAPSKAGEKMQSSSRGAPDGAELPSISGTLGQVRVDDPFDIVTSSQDSASPVSSGADITMTEGSSGMDDSRMSLEQSIHESFLLNTNEMPSVPTDQGVEDIDAENTDDISYAPLYAHDIFNYYKERELQFLVPAYMGRQPQLSAAMRAILVDWLVEVQENFELNHETLYLAVKLTDTYLANIHSVPRDHLQLIGAAALFLACKFDERVPPAVEDFLYVCDDAYRKQEFLSMERDLLRTVGFDLGRPISYRFLRRYAKCGRSPIVTLTLARYILELSLMEYKFVSYRDSLLAASCLYIARRMQQEEVWTPTLEYYTGYKLSDLRSTVLELNPILTSPHYAHLTTIRAKYNHVVFHAVAKLPTLSNSQLFPDLDQQ